MKKACKILSLILLVVVALSSALFLLTACQKKDKVKVINYKLTNEEYAFCINRTDSAMLAQIDSFLIEIKSNGTLNKIVARYFGSSKPQGVKSAPSDSENALVVVTSADFPPFEYVEGDVYYGIDMEIAAAFAQKLGKKLVIKNVRFASVLNELQMGHANVAIAAISVVDARKNFITFSNGYYMAGQVIMTKVDDDTFSACTNAEEVRSLLLSMDSSKRIGYQNSSSAYYYLYGKSREFTDEFSVEGKGYDTVSSAVDAMLNGEVDFVMTDSAAAEAIARQFNK
ncbi:MAG: transporter substrate-binding domain-containing protein [Clostridia bacterium]|nr:transporter substrate-binding domain-containing protein [Clostridia bacterium]